MALRSTSISLATFLCHPLCRCGPRLLFGTTEMTRVLFAISALFLFASCNAGYGPLEDHREFVSARLADDKRTIVFSAHHFAYRLATGWRAFPDGGIPDYVTDINLLGVYDLQTRDVKILRRERNTEWQAGSGLFTIHSMKGGKALVSQGGQLRGPFRLGVKHLLLDFKAERTEVLDLKSDLAMRGRDLGYIYIVDTDGTLIFVTLSLEEAKDSSAYRHSAVVPEVWARTPVGDYVKVAATAHYQCVRNNEVIYWDPTTRDFMAFSITNGTTRKAEEFKVAGYEDVDTGITLSSDRKALQSGTKAEGQWKYQRLELSLDELK